MAGSSSLGRVEPIERTRRGFDGRWRDVGVDGGGSEVAVSEQDLDDRMSVPALQQVGGEAVAQGVDGDVLAQPRGLPRLGRPCARLPVWSVARGRTGEEVLRGSAAFQYSRRTASKRGESMT